MLQSCRHLALLSPYNTAVLAMVVICAVSLDIGPALGELRYTTEYRTNPIKGTTPEQVRRYMAAHPIIDEDGPARANITHDHNLSVKSKKSGGACVVDNLDFSWRFVITLPEAVDKARMSAATRAKWEEFTAYLKWHEEHHRTIFLRCGKQFLAEAAKITKPRNCFGMKRKVRQFVEGRYDACMVTQRAFDRDERKRVENLSLLRTSGQ